MSQQYASGISKNLSSSFRKPEFVAAIGISLGTKYCCVGVFRNGKFELIPNEFGNRLTPSVIAFNNEELLIGESALRQGPRNTKNIIHNVKRFIGRRPGEKNVQLDEQFVSYRVDKKDPRISFGIEARGRENLTPEEITAILLRNQKNLAEDHLNSEVTDVVITVPASFNNSQREATKDAAYIAGFKNIQLINEPTAAALAYGIENNVVDRKTILVFNLGGGSFDVSIVEISKKARIKVISTSGDSSFGGESFVQQLFTHFASEFQNEHKKNLRDDLQARRKLLSACESVLKTLTHSEDASIGIDSLFDGIDFDVKITRQTFEKICYELFARIRKTVRKTLKDVNYEVSRVDSVVLVGGASRIPRVAKELENIFDKRKMKYSINREEAAVHGAALKAAKLEIISIEEILFSSIDIKTKFCRFETAIKQNSIINESRLMQSFNEPQIDGLYELYEKSHTSSPSQDKLLGSFLLVDIPQAKPHSSAVIEIIVKIDGDGIVGVLAKLRSENSEPSQIQVKFQTYKLPPSEIGAMTQKIERIYEANRNYHDLAEATNKMECFILKMDNFMAENGSRVTPEDKRSHLEVIKWIETHNLESKSDIDRYYEYNCKPLIIKYELMK